MAEALTAREHQEGLDELIVGNSPAIKALKQMILRVARSDASVMITGPSGCGKEMVARALHSISNRKTQAMVALNCGAIPGELLESELFGHERGAFTGAHSRRVGRFEEADKGTLFLDEIGDMPFDMQVKLLRVLEDSKVNRVGGSAAIPVDVRIVSATHQNIDRAIENGRFREDLYFRLGVIPIVVPDLASRVEDIPLLVAHFQRGKAASQTARFDSGAMKKMMQYGWPGNVRELRNIVERAGVLFGQATVTADHVEQLLSLSHRGAAPVAINLGAEPMPVPTEAQLATEADNIPASRPSETPAQDPLAHASQQLDGPINLREMLENMELNRINAALESADGVISEAARLLMLKRTTLIEKMRKYGVEKLC